MERRELNRMFDQLAPSPEQEQAALMVISVAADITDALRTEGCYTYNIETEEGQLHILVEGTAEEWAATVMIGEPGENAPLSTITNRNDGSGEASSPAYPVPFVDEGGDNTDIPDLAPAE